MCGIRQPTARAERNVVAGKTVCSTRYLTGRFETTVFQDGRHCRKEGTKTTHFLLKFILILQVVNKTMMGTTRWTQRSLHPSLSSFPSTGTVFVHVGRPSLSSHTQLL